MLFFLGNAFIKNKYTEAHIQFERLILFACLTTVKLYVSLHIHSVYLQKKYEDDDIYSIKYILWKDTIVRSHENVYIILCIQYFYRTFKKNYIVIFILIFSLKISNRSKSHSCLIFFLHFLTLKVCFCTVRMYVCEACQKKNIDRKNISMAQK